ncbi:MAG: hypothetical protein SCH70_05865 [Candidatus Methanoperedens sp.]|nr:hypothetical protein [Candidatus Methanoperedens sp.]
MKQAGSVKNPVFRSLSSMGEGKTRLINDFFGEFEPAVEGFDRVFEYIKPPGSAKKKNKPDRNNL